MKGLAADTEIETAPRLTPRPKPADAGAMKHLYARHRLDIRPADLLHALSAMPAGDQKRAAVEAEHVWSAGGPGLACYSVRSGFHLLLKALALPRGSEVLFSAVTHPDMPRLALHHGLGHPLLAVILEVVGGVRGHLGIGGGEFGPEGRDAAEKATAEVTVRLVADGRVE